MMRISQRSSGGALLCGMMFALMLLVANGQTAQAQKFKKETLVVNLQTQIGTANSKKGDVFTALVLQPAELTGAVVEGTVDKVVPGGDKSHLVVQFSTITMPDNNTYRLKATFKDVIYGKGAAKIEGANPAVSATPVKKSLFGGSHAGAASPTSGLAFSVIGPTLSSIAAGGEAISLDVAAPGPNMSFAPGTRFILDADNAGQEKSVNAYQVRFEAAKEALRAHADEMATASPAAHASAPTMANPNQPAAAASHPAGGSPPQQ